MNEAIQYQPRTWMETSEALLSPMKTLGTITEEAQAKWVADQLKFAKRLFKQIKEEMDAHLEQPLAEAKKIRADYSVAIKNAEAAVELATAALRRYAFQVEESRRSALEALEKAKQRAVATGAPQELPKEVVKAPPALNLAGTGIHVRQRWTFRVVDFSKVPDTMKMIDSQAVNRAIESGSRGGDIAGIEIYQEKAFVDR
jgi:hypothetical protein